MKRCAKCGGEITGKRRHALYCSNGCKAAAQKERDIRRYSGGLNGAGPNYQQNFIIGQLQRERDKLERDNTVMANELKAAKEAAQRLREQLTEQKHSHEISDLKRDYEKPTGLAGLGETITKNGLIDKCMPLIMAYMGNQTAPAPPPANGLGMAQPDTEGRQMAMAIAQWFEGLGSTQQKQVYEGVIMPLSNTADITAMVQLINDTTNSDDNGIGE